MWTGLSSLDEIKQSISQMIGLTTCSWVFVIEQIKRYYEVGVVIQGIKFLVCLVKTVHFYGQARCKQSKRLDGQEKFLIFWGTGWEENMLDQILK